MVKHYSQRRGLGRGRGSGYHNILGGSAGFDHHMHQLAGHHVKSYYSPLYAKPISGNDNDNDNGYILCPRCKGKMRVFVSDEGMIPCPTCEGEGHITQEEAKELQKEGFELNEKTKKFHAKSIKTADIVSKPIITEQELNLLKRRLNEGKVKDTEIFGESYNKTYLLTPEQNKKGYDWLMDKWKSPSGVVRKHNPFGFREQDALSKFDHFELVGFMDDTTIYQNQAGIHNYIPIYDVITKEDYGFQYYVKNGEPFIIG